ncbi:hypothetical protein E5163_10760 [Marinicauda algicola]|uniref:Uncharacterized protein n=1 Tax=Marinicauda algicola TaxID=2029849 RepID=A0A4S2GYT9_9PROT|nr:hypothetical protein [Marinicauda algicola]TGY88296.1 hypothetical protein E5163_10760 [Marinicauda algicola]
MLDTQTLFVALIPVLLAGLVAHIANSQIHRNSIALRWWGWGMMAQALGVVAIAGHEALPFFLAVLVGTAGLVGGQFMILQGMAVFSRLEVARAYYLTAGALSLAGVSFFTLAENSAPARFLVISAALIAAGRDRTCLSEADGAHRRGPSPLAVAR